jgi:Fuseless
VLLGAGAGVVFALLRPPLTRIACSNAQRTLRQRVCAVLASWLYLALFAVASIAFWRGSWELIDLHCGKSYQLYLFSIGLGGACLARLKCVRNLSGPPFTLVPDLKDNIFNFPTRYRTSVSAKTAYGLDLLPSGERFSYQCLPKCTEIAAKFFC